MYLYLGSGGKIFWKDVDRRAEIIGAGEIDGFFDDLRAQCESIPLSPCIPVYESSSLFIPSSVPSLPTPPLPFSIPSPCLLHPFLLHPYHTTSNQHTNLTKPPFSRIQTPIIDTRPRPTNTKQPHPFQSHPLHPTIYPNKKYDLRSLIPDRPGCAGFLSVYEWKKERMIEGTVSGVEWFVVGGLSGWMVWWLVTEGGF